jgi:peptide/nickel transport system substrate-binding protein
MHVRWRAVWFTALGLVLLGLAHPGFAQTEQESGRFGGRVTIGKVAVGSLMFQPLYISLGVEREIASLIYGEGLLRQDDKGRMTSGLAYPPLMMNGGREWIFRIQQGLRFHDGYPLSADDVVFTYLLYKQSRAYDPIFHRYFQNLETIQAVDLRTVRFVMKEPVAEFPLALATLPILPRHQQDSRPFADVQREADLSRPVGLGPFRLETWPVHDTVVLMANRHWYRGRPYLDSIVYRFYASTEELQAAFIKREVDVVEVDRASNFAELKRARSDARIQAVQPRHRSFAAVFYNHQHPILSNRVVRQALTYATDRVRIISQLMTPGTGSLAHSPVDESFWAQGGAIRYKYEPGKALGLLKQTGWRDSDHDGILNFGKQPLQFELLFPRGSLSSEKVVRMIKLNLNDIGVNVIPTPVDQKELVQRLRLGLYEAALYIQDFESTPDDFYAVFHSESIDLGFNRLRYQNRQVDRAISFLYGITDRSRALPIYQNLQMLLSDDQPCMFLYFVNAQYVAYDPRCQNVGLPGTALNSPAVWYLLSEAQ